jgi:hypothetical protein
MPGITTLPIPTKKSAMIATGSHAPADLARIVAQEACGRARESDEAGSDQPEALDELLQRLQEIGCPARRPFPGLCRHGCAQSLQISLDCAP